MYYTETNNLTIIMKDKAFGKLDITMISPGDQKARVGFRYAGDVDIQNVIFNIEIIGENFFVHSYITQIDDGNEGYFIINKIFNNMEYTMMISAFKKSNNELIAKSPVRLLKTGVVPGVAVNYLHPEDYTYDSSGRSPASPSIAKASDGRLFVSHDIYWKLGGQNITKIFSSEDNGESWRYLSDVTPCFWGKLIFHEENLYMLGMSTEYGSLLIFRSKDRGKKWSEPTEILGAGSREKGGLHKAPMPIIEHNGRLWTAIDHGSWDRGGHDSGVVSVPVNADLMDGKNWTATPFLPYNSKWEGTIKGGEKPGLLEGNVVIAPDGRLMNFLRYNTIGGNPDYGKAIILKVDKENPGACLEFFKVVDFPGNMSKFTIGYDKKSNKYYSLVNRVTGDHIKQRNILTLTSSQNLVDWKIERDFLNYEDNGWPENDAKVAFQYADWIFEDDDILAVSRTAVNGAHSFHNANHITFHRFRNFRR